MYKLSGLREILLKLILLSSVKNFEIKLTL